MAWKAYRLVYRAAGPTHIGWHRLGFIQRTRFYITGRNMWGALTSAVTMRTQAHGFDTSLYKKVGTEVFNKSVIASYFYPALDPDRPLLPLHTDEGLKYGDMTADGFEREVVASLGQTAISTGRNTAEEGSLHETEFICGVAAGWKRIYFTGYFFIEDGLIPGYLSALQEACREIFIGGERRYGFGRLVLDNTDEAFKKDSTDFFGHELDSSQKEVLVKIGKGRGIPAHLHMEEGQPLSGDIEPVVGRNWCENSGPGRALSRAAFCWTPGSVVEKEGGMGFRLAEYGMLRG